MPLNLHAKQINIERQTVIPLLNEQGDMPQASLGRWASAMNSGANALIDLLFGHAIPLNLLGFLCFFGAVLLYGCDAVLALGVE